MATARVHEITGENDSEFDSDSSYDSDSEDSISVKEALEEYYRKGKIWGSWAYSTGGRWLFIGTSSLLVLAMPLMVMMHMETAMEQMQQDPKQRAQGQAGSTQSMSGIPDA
eukprot:41850_1